MHQDGRTFSYDFGRDRVLSSAHVADLEQEGDGRSSQAVSQSSGGGIELETTYQSLVDDSSSKRGTDGRQPAAQRLSVRECLRKRIRAEERAREKSWRGRGIVEGGSSTLPCQQLGRQRRGMVHPQQIARQAVMSNRGKHKGCWLIQIAAACCQLKGLVPEDWNLESASGVSPSRSAGSLAAMLVRGSRVGQIQLCTLLVSQVGRRECLGGRRQGGRGEARSHDFGRSRGADQGGLIPALPLADLTETTRRRKVMSIGHELQLQ